MSKENKETRRWYRNGVVPIETVDELRKILEDFDGDAPVLITSGGSVLNVGAVSYGNVDDSLGFERGTAVFVIAFDKRVRLEDDSAILMDR